MTSSSKISTSKKTNSNPRVKYLWLAPDTVVKQHGHFIEIGQYIYYTVGICRHLAVAASGTPAYAYLRGVL